MSDRLLAFVSLGVLSAAQQLASRVIADMHTADPDRAAEETLVLVAAASARAVAAGFQGGQKLTAVLLDLPVLYRDYLAGGLVLRGELDDAAVRARITDEGIRRRRSFYEAHFEADGVPAPAVLRDKMGLWMGRISPPGLEESPMDRLDRLRLVDVLGVHLRLLHAYARRQSDADSHLALSDRRSE